MLVLVLLSFVPLAAGLGRTQSVGVRGTLICNDKPASDVEVKLYDEDKLSPDELMATGRTDSQGHFEIKGHAEEFTSIEPKLNIYHDCDDGIMPCQRKLSIHIPDAYISSGETPKKIFDFGTFQLAGKYAGETRDCLHRV
ncbi:Transthyretin-like family protein [Oesophagostomum dentatum]|uniref:Transthyretin-like family protein n=1 Tax=Oesophagostomum dentatum TaxID=61180 RepID=A0A0B1T4N3_OESDE|nr:Transthyretin-like family protein [Oesophagostomum dentatum]